MSAIRFRIRTIMIAVALAAVVMCILRFTLLIYDFFGFDFLYFVAVNFTRVVFIPIVTIVETWFFVGYFWLGRKGAGQMSGIGRIGSPPLSGESEGAYVKNGLENHQRPPMPSQVGERARPS